MCKCLLYFWFLVIIVCFSSFEFGFFEGYYMVIICLVCGGLKKCLFYNIVVIDLCNCCDGCFIECVGFYNLVVMKGELLCIV